MQSTFTEGSAEIALMRSLHLAYEKGIVRTQAAFAESLSNHDKTDTNMCGAHTTLILMKYDLALQILIRASGEKNSSLSVWAEFTLTRKIFVCITRLITEQRHAISNNMAF